jgi:flagellar hook-basal body complex protein FliE
MIKSIGPQISISSVKVPNPASPEGIKGAQGDDFAQTLMDVLKEVNQSQSEARSKQNAFMTGQPVEFHDLMIAMEKASTAMQLTLQVRNKLLEGYQEINRMQV